MTFIVVPDSEAELATRSFEISYRRLRFAVAVLALAVLLLVAMASSWWYVAAQAARVPGLKRQVTLLEGERERVVELAEALVRLERQYGQVRALLGADQAPDATAPWLPQSSAARRAAAAGSETIVASLPTSWPLAQRGFITREHLARVAGQHPGLDIAVAEGSYVRASGAGMVAEAGEDPVYGKFVRIRHQDGYETMYAHASMLFVAADDTVERHEVIALSGNTGRSTAPHLHFEVRKDGEPIDPREIVQPPD